MAVNNTDCTRMSRIEAWNFMKKLSDGTANLIVRQKLSDGANGGKALGETVTKEESGEQPHPANAGEKSNGASADKATNPENQKEEVSKPREP